ncbi:hypothetical protein I7I53_12236 [Histoplasma capsulatum var. duboisii H88]|uniref:Transmembrane protein n=1 Tax=Ajellomyces capsulatus (strain H88) TaxID=544711 RepID=A0A8A1LUV9_AJEC8|nr:hypothetical protein I7I53_12236 [Histoplasma capsulatum var. duboisii H88]
MNVLSIDIISLSRFFSLGSFFVPFRLPLPRFPGFPRLVAPGRPNLVKPSTPSTPSPLQPAKQPPEPLVPAFPTQGDGYCIVFFIIFFFMLFVFVLNYPDLTIELIPIRRWVFGSCSGRNCLTGGVLFACGMIGHHWQLHLLSYRLLLE